MSAQIRQALHQLGIERLVLSMHQLSFPAGDDDLGIGTPYGPRARDLMKFAERLGKNTPARKEFIVSNLIADIA